MPDRSLARRRPADSSLGTPTRLGAALSATPSSTSAGQTSCTSTLNQIVLAEEEYVAALSYLIRRDFFPDNEGVNVAITDEGQELSDAYLPVKVIEHLGVVAAESLTIGSFQANFTSEDNASFQDILEIEKKRRRKAYGWAYEAEEKGKGKARNALFYPPPTLEGTSSADRLLTAGAKQGNASSLNSKQVNHRGTRLFPSEEDEGEGSQLGSTSPRSSRIAAAIDGTGSVSELSALDGETDGKSSESYSFVKPVASPRFQNMSRKQQAQLMTWGKIASTPRAVNGASDNTNEEVSAYEGRFRIPPTPKRDILARSLANKKANTSTSTSTRSSVTPLGKRTAADLTPAARTLLERTTRRRA
jgi:protein DGCR14